MTQKSKNAVIIKNDLPGITTTETDKAAGGFINDFLTPFAQTIATPIELVAKTLGVPLSIIHRQLSLLNFSHSAYVQKSLSRYYENVKSIDESNLLSVVPEIACEILPKLPVTSSETKRELLITLLTNATNKKTVSEVHPRFIWIVSQMCEEEISILKYVNSTTSKVIPYCRFHFSIGSQALIPNKLYFHTDFKKLAGEKSFDLLIRNLYSLGLFDKMEDEWENDTLHYYPLIEQEAQGEQEFNLALNDSRVINKTPTIVRSHFKLNEIGEHFMRAIDLKLVD